MDVTCEHCGTEYEFDETLVSDRGTTVKCTQCGHLFRVFRAGGAPDPEGSQWLVRRGDGSIEPIASIRELRQRIAGGDLSERDEISTAGQPYKALGSIAELEGYFAAASEARAQAEAQAARAQAEAQAARAQAEAQATRAPSPVRPKQTLIGVGLHDAPTVAGSFDAPTVVGSFEAPTVAVPTQAGSFDAPTVAVPTQAAGLKASATPTIRGMERVQAVPAPALPELRAAEPQRAPEPSADEDADLTSPDAPPSFRERLDVAEMPHATATLPAATSPATPNKGLHIADEDEAERPRRSKSARGASLAIGLTLLLGLGAGAYALRDQIPGLAEAPQAANLDVLAEARAGLARDDRAGYGAATADFERLAKSPELAAPALAGASRAQAALAQLLAFEAHDLEVGRAPTDADRAAAAALRVEMDAAAKRARELAEGALRLDPEGAEPALCLADALRLAGNVTAAEEHLSRARALGTADQGEVYRASALLSAAKDGGALSAARHEARLALELSPSTVRYRALLARALLAAGDAAGARALLAAAPAQHAQLRAVNAQIDAQQVDVQ